MLSIFPTFLVQAGVCDFVSHSSPSPSPMLTTDPVKPHSEASLDPPKPGARAKPKALDRQMIEIGRTTQSQEVPGQYRAHSELPNSASSVFQNSLRSTTEEHRMRRASGS